MCFVFVLFSCVTEHVFGTKDVTALHVAVCVFYRPSRFPQFPVKLTLVCKIDVLNSREYEQVHGTREHASPYTNR